MFIHKLFEETYLLIDYLENIQQSLTKDLVKLLNEEDTYKYYSFKPSALTTESVYQAFTHNAEAFALKSHTTIRRNLVANIMGDATATLSKKEENHYVYASPHDTIETFFYDDLAVVAFTNVGNVSYYKRDLSSGLLTLLGDIEILHKPEQGVGLIPCGKFITYIHTGDNRDSTWGCKPGQTKYQRLSCPILTSRENTSLTEYLELLEYLATYILGPETAVDIDFRRTYPLRIKKKNHKDFIHSKAKKNIEFEELIKILRKVYNPFSAKLEAKTTSSLLLPSLLLQYEEKYGPAEECIVSIKHMKENYD